MDKRATSGSEWFLNMSWRWLWWSIAAQPLTRVLWKFYSIPYLNSSQSMSSKMIAYMSSTSKFSNWRSTKKLRIKPTFLAQISCSTCSNSSETQQKLRIWMLRFSITRSRSIARCETLEILMLLTSSSSSCTSSSSELNWVVRMPISWITTTSGSQFPCKTWPRSSSSSETLRMLSYISLSPKRSFWASKRM